MIAIENKNVVEFWESKVIQFLTDNGNTLGKFDHENEKLTFITNYNDIVTVSYEKLKFRMNEAEEKEKNNPWIWTELAEILKPDRIAGMKVPVGYLMRGSNEWFPYSSWVDKGYIKRIDEL